MSKNLELTKAQTHAAMPASYVEFVRRLWHRQLNASRYSWSHDLATARRSVFLKLLASERLGTELRRVYETPVGPQIAEALTSQAVHIPELWESEDKRTKKEKAAQFKKLRTAIKEVSALLDQDRSMPDEEDLTEPGTARYPRGKRSSSKVDARAHRPIPAAFENVLSEQLVVSRWNWPPQFAKNLKGARLQLSLYQFHEILQAFDKPLRRMIENINKFRTHATDDPLLRHMGQIPKGTAWIRYAALLLDQRIDRFNNDFKKCKLSRDKLVSAFVTAIYPNTNDESANYKAMNRICRLRRKLIANSFT
jgi:hypothetical protein